MNIFQMDPNIPPDIFSACDPINNYYQSLNVPSTLSSEYGGKKYTWHVDYGQSYIITCSCGINTLSNGYLEIRPSLKSRKFSSKHTFQKDPIVNSKTGVVIAKTPFKGVPFEIQLPIPDKKAN